MVEQTLRERYSGVADTIQVHDTELVQRAEKILRELGSDERVATPEKAKEYFDIEPKHYILAKEGNPEQHVKAELLTTQAEQFAMMKARQCFEEIKIALHTFCDIPEHYYTVLALWIMGTWCHDEFDTFPLLFFNAVKGSGKTRLMKLCLALSRNGKMVLDMKESVLFRTAKGHTIGIDEFEGMASKEASTIRTMINACYKKGNAVERMAKVKKEGKETFEVERFDLYTPLMMANIWGVEEVVQDRCLVVILDKSENKAITKLMEDFEQNPFFNEIKFALHQIQCTWCSVLRSKSYRRAWNIHTLYTYNTSSTLYTLTTSPLFKEEIVITPEMKLLFDKIDKTGLNGRNLELFFPLFILAESLGNSILDEILAVAQKIVESKRSEEMAESKDIALLEFISTQEQWRGGYILISEILKVFKYTVPLTEEEQKWLNAHWLGRSIKRQNLILGRRRVNAGNQVILDIDKAKLRMRTYKEEVKENG